VSPLDSTNPQGVVVAKPRSDVYTTMLFLALIAILVACLCLYLEMRAYNMDIKATEASVPSTAAVWPGQGYGNAPMHVALNLPESQFQRT
jgi:hypothetical protein